MESAYTYSATRVRTLATSLVRLADVERLLVAQNDEDLRTALRESYVASYVPDGEWQIDAILALHQYEAYQLALSIAPNPEVLCGALARYDFHNIRVLAKARVLNLDYDQTMRELSSLGWHTPQELYAHAVSDTLHRVANEFQYAYQQAYWHTEAGEVDRAEQAVDSAYWQYRSRVAAAADDEFIQQLLRLEIDFYNVRNRLRAEVVDRFDFSKLFQSGGSVPSARFTSAEGARSVLQAYGGHPFWEAALHQYDQGTASALERAMRSYVRSYVHQASYDVFCSAALLDYFYAVEAAADVMRTVVLGKQNGQSDTDIRSQLTPLI